MRFRDVGGDYYEQVYDMTSEEFCSLICQGAFAVDCPVDESDWVYTYEMVEGERNDQFVPHTALGKQLLDIRRQTRAKGVREAWFLISA